MYVRGGLRWKGQVLGTIDQAELKQLQLRAANQRNYRNGAQR